MAHPRWTGHQGTRTSTWGTPLALCGARWPSSAQDVALRTVGLLQWLVATCRCLFWWLELVFCTFWGGIVYVIFFVLIVIFLRYTGFVRFYVVDFSGFRRFKSWVDDVIFDWTSWAYSLTRGIPHKDVGIAWLVWSFSKIGSVDWAPPPTDSQWESKLIIPAPHGKSKMPGCRKWAQFKALAGCSDWEMVAPKHSQGYQHCCLQAMNIGNSTIHWP